MSGLLAAETVTIQPRDQTTVAGKVSYVADGDPYTAQAAIAPAR